MAKNLLIFLMIAAISTGTIFITGCESDAKTGAAVGGAAGAGIGQMAGRDTESTLIGAAIGAGAGYIIGNEQDKKKAESEPVQPVK